jgi:hypothetical protein
MRATTASLPRTPVTLTLVALALLTVLFLLA